MKTKQFTETLIDYVDGKVRRNDLMFKLTLGGGAGPGGGEGLPWNSIIGQLIQKRVAYDTTMSASPCMDSASGYWLQSGSLLDNLNIIRYRQLPATWFETSPTDLRGLSVTVASGVWYDAENSYFIFSGGTSPVFTLPVTNPRIDVVYVTSAGAIEIQQGTEAPSPSITMPTASGVLPTWAVYLPPGASGIGYPCETYSGYLYQDLRPFMAYPPGGGGDGVGAHNILQADVHIDTITQACNQGSLILGNAANKWDELPLGGANFALFSTGATAVWADPLPPVAGAGYAWISDGVNSWAVDQTPTWTGPHLFQDVALNTVNPCYVIEIDYIKTAGATGAADDMAGIYSVFQFDQVGGTIGDLYGAYIEAEIANGTTGAASDIWGIYTYVDLDGGTADRDVWGLQAKVYGHGTVVDEDIWGLDGWIALNTGSVGGDVIGLSSWIDIAAGYTSPGRDVYGLYTYVDVNVVPVGEVYMLYLDEQDGIDYGVYQNGTADNYLGGKLGVGDTTPVTEIHARTAAGMCRIRTEYNTTTNLGAFEIYEGAAYKASIHVDGSAVAAPNVYLRNCLSITTGTGDIHLKPGSTHVGINLAAAPTEALDISGNIALAAGNTVDGLDLSELGDMFFNTADGLLLLGPHCEINTTEWWSLRRQKATLSGAFHQEAGRWIDTRGLVIEEATTNLVENPSLEVNTTHWAARGVGTTITRITTDSTHGEACLQVTVADVAGAGFYIHAAVGDQITVAPNTDYTFSIYAKRTFSTSYAANLQITWRTAGGAAISDDTVAITILPGWHRYSLTATSPATAGLAYLSISRGVAGVHTYYVDAAQFEAKGYPTSYCDGSLGAGYAWTGGAHASTSTRTKTEVNLNTHAHLVSGNDTLTFVCWVQMPYDANTSGLAPYIVIFDTRGANEANRIILGYRPANDQFSVYANGVWGRPASALQTFKAGDWLQLVLTQDYSTNHYKLYVNTVMTESTVALVTPTLTEWNVGSDYAGNCQGGFRFSEYAVFDRALTAVEVAQLYNLQRPLVDAGALTKPHGQFESVVTGMVVGTEGMLRGHGDIGGYMYWEGSVANGGETTVIPDGVGDVAYGLNAITIGTDRTGAGPVEQHVFAMDTPGAGSITSQIHFGPSVVVLRLYSTGRLTIDETAGIDTICVNLWLTWQ